MEIPSQGLDKYVLGEARTCACLCWITANVEEKGKTGKARQGDGYSSCRYLSV